LNDIRRLRLFIYAALLFLSSAGLTCNPVLIFDFTGVVVVNDAFSWGGGTPNVLPAIFFSR
jgi:hypothetical protein